MKKFTLKMLFFLTLFIGAFLLVSAVLNSSIRSRNLFVIKEKSHGLIMGNSHAACGLDDQYIKGFKNLGSVTESYLYSYIKLKEVVKANPQIDILLLEFDNIQINEQWVNKWLWQTPAMTRFLPKYQPFMTTKELSFFALNNPTTFVSIQRLMARQGVEIASTPSFNYVSLGRMGKNSQHNISTADSLLKLAPKPNEMLEDKDAIHDLNLEYLNKIRLFCIDNHIQLILFRTPVLENAACMENEQVFQRLVSEKMKDFSFVDLQNFPMSTNHFYDLDHLNIKGSEKLSKFISSAIDEGFLKQADMQSFINNRMDSMQVQHAQFH